MVPPDVQYVTTSFSLRTVPFDAFKDHKGLQRIVITGKVTHIGEYAFCGCSNLREVVFEEPSSLVEIGWNTFKKCPKIEEIKLPYSLEKLGNFAFAYCRGLQKVTLSPKMTTIDGDTFRGCSSLTTVAGMKSITYIGQWAFSECSSLLSIDVNESTDIDEYAFELAYYRRA